MKVLHQSIYAAHYFDVETKTMYSNWFVATQDMSAKDFVDEIEAWLAASLEVKPERIFDFCCNFVYPISPDEQIWMAELLNSKWIEIGLKRYAHILPNELFSQISSEQLFDEFYGMNLPNQFKIKNFSEGDIENARKWLFS